VSVRFDPAAARAFAVDVVRKLRDAGFQALWAGGCVRDQLLGRQPKDYDVATNARPEQVQQVFGKRKSLAIGASFGVITVIGPKEVGQLDVATFRKDAAYSDGRHPDSVTFSEPHEDAQRRDFTINGLFYDPIADQVIDYVGGQDDLKAGIIRAIGDPCARIAEDKLRMLRAVRFTATFGFQLEDATLNAIREQATELVIVSAERIAAELRRMLTIERRRHAVELLASAQLLEVILPEIKGLHTIAWEQTLAIIEQIPGATFTQSVAALLRPLAETPPTLQQLADTVCRRLKLSVDELEQVQRFLREEPILRTCSKLTWPQIQRMLVVPGIEAVLDYSATVSHVVAGDSGDLDICTRMLALPQHLFNPPQLITGDDLKNLLSLQPGPHFKTILEKVRDTQLDSLINTPEEALALAQKLASQLLAT
jgi:tRNA nucleotidyltransferase/poly(A) polymerase